MPRPFPSGLATESVVSGRGQNPGTPGPAGPPGPGFQPNGDLSGTSTEQAVVGFRGRPLAVDEPQVGQTQTFDGAQWKPSGANASVGALSSTLFVDAGTSVAPADQDGSPSSPFSQISSAADFIAASGDFTNWLVLVGPGSYLPFTLSGKHYVVVRGPGQGAVRVTGTVTLSPPPFFDSFEMHSVLEGITATGPVFVDTFSYPTPPRVVLRDCDVAGVDEESGGSLEIWRSRTDYVLSTGTIKMRASTVDGETTVSSNPLDADACSFNGNVTAAGSRLTRCRFGAGAVVTSPFSTVRMYFDGETIEAVLNAGGQIVSDYVGCLDYPDYKVLVPVLGAGSTNAYPLCQLPVGASVTLDIYAVAQDSVSGDTASFRYVATFKNLSGTPVQVGSTSVLHSEKDDPSWDLGFQLVSGLVQASITGDSANPTSWTVLSRQTSRPMEI